MRFEYVAPKELSEISKLKEEGGVLFSGGTDVFVKMRAGAIAPNLLVDTKKVQLPKLECDGNLKIYMNATYTNFLTTSCAKDFPLLSRVLIEVGSPQIRNRGTPIGNVGNASPAGDFLLTLYVHDSKVILAPSMREVRIEDLVTGPGRLSLEPAELIHSIEISPLEGYRFYYEKVGRRNALVISIASIALAIKLDGDVIEDIRVAYGSVGPTVVRFKDLEEKMKGKKFERGLFEEVAEEYANRVKPITDVRATAEYRKKLVRNLLIKAFLSLKG